MASWSYYGAAATTAIAGILHVYLAAGSISHGRFGNNVILFLVGGLAQIFWILPILKRWGRIWYVIGIAGTIVLVGLWTITRVQGNPITGRGLSVGYMDTIIEIMQVAFIALCFVILGIESRSAKQQIV
jgi:hypothetical protein